ncbi:flavin reductase [Clostridia bacterium]|nr:flavin reductase [Clostridia bacterium]
MIKTEIGEFSRVFDTIGKQWMLLTATVGDKINPMTCSWGGLGILWGLPVAYSFVRPQRYTQEMLPQCDRYTLTFFDEKYRDALNYCGTKSGRDGDKVSAAGLTPVRDSRGFSYFEEADWTLCVKKLYVQQFDPAGAVDPALFAKNYPADDFHYMYVGEIEDVLRR